MHTRPNLMSAALRPPGVDLLAGDVRALALEQGPNALTNDRVIVVDDDTQWHLAESRHTGGSPVAVRT